MWYISSILNLLRDFFCCCLITKECCILSNASLHLLRAFQVALVVKNLSASAEDLRDSGSTPGLGRSPGGGHGNPLQYFCLEDPMDRGAWWATVHGVAKSQTVLSN